MVWKIYFTNKTEKPILKIIRVLLVWITLAFTIPLVFSAIFNIPLRKTLSLITSTFLLEYFAVPFGIALKITAPFVLFVVLFVALSVVYLIFSLLDIFEEKLKITKIVVEKARRKSEKSKIIKKYGVLSLPVLVVILGFYITPAVAWLFGWRRFYSAIMIIFGFLAISLAMLFSTLGILNLLM